MILNGKFGVQILKVLLLMFPLVFLCAQQRYSAGDRQAETVSYLQSSYRIFNSTDVGALFTVRDHKPTPLAAETAFLLMAGILPFTAVFILKLFFFSIFIFYTFRILATKLNQREALLNTFLIATFPWLISEFYYYDNMMAALAGLVMYSYFSTGVEADEAFHQKFGLALGAFIALGHRPAEVGITIGLLELRNFRIKRVALIFLPAILWWVPFWRDLYDWIFLTDRNLTHEVLAIIDGQYWIAMFRELLGVQFLLLIVGLVWICRKNSAVIKKDYKFLAAISVLPVILFWTQTRSFQYYYPSMVLFYVWGLSKLQYLNIKFRRVASRIVGLFLFINCSILLTPYSDFINELYMKSGLSNIIPGEDSPVLYPPQHHPAADFFAQLKDRFGSEKKIALMVHSFWDQGLKEGRAAFYLRPNVAVLWQRQYQLPWKLELNTDLSSLPKACEQARNEGYELCILVFAAPGAGNVSIAPEVRAQQAQIFELKLEKEKAALNFIGAFDVKFNRETQNVRLFSILTP